MVNSSSVIDSLLQHENCVEELKFCTALLLPFSNLGVSLQYLLIMFYHGHLKVAQGFCKLPTGISWREFKRGCTCRCVGMCICADIHVHANMPVEQSLLGRMCMYFVCACVHIQSEVCISVFLISGHLYVH